MTFVHSADLSNMSVFTGHSHVSINTHLVTECVTAHHDWLCPARHYSRDVRDDNWLTEDCAVQDVADCAVRTAKQQNQNTSHICVDSEHMDMCASTTVADNEISMHFIGLIQQYAASKLT